jgi:hypothetical protein
MAMFPPRDLEAEVRKYFSGTAEEPILTALRLGQEALDLFLATLPPGTSRERARSLMQRNTHPGHRPSRVLEAEHS